MKPPLPHNIIPYIDKMALHRDRDQVFNPRILFRPPFVDPFLPVFRYL